MKAIPDVRPSPIAGQWYPADSQRLAALVNGYIHAARLPVLEGEIVAVMAPHAGYRYSGPVAGYAFAAVRGMCPDLVVVVSPMHYPHPQPLLTSGHSAYATPLGVIPIDRQAVSALDSALQDRLDFGLAPLFNDPEHSLEIELPFLQCALAGPFHLLPVMVRDQSQDSACGLGQALAEILHGRSALLVASTDLSHFYSQPAAARLDAEMLRQVQAFDPQGVLRVEMESKAFACGRGALAAVLWAAKDLGADQVHILQYATSGDVTGDFDQVVGYAAAAVTRRN